MISEMLAIEKQGNQGTLKKKTLIARTRTTNKLSLCTCLNNYTYRHGSL